MAGCLDNFTLPRFNEWFELSEKRNAVASIVAGTLVCIYYLKLNKSFLLFEIV